MDFERLEIAINARIDGFEANIDKADKGLLRISNSAKETGESLTKYVTLPLGLLAGAAIKTAGDMQALEKGFAAVYKGAGDVGVELKKVQDLAKQPGLGLKEAEQGSIRLQAVGFSAEEARKSLSAFGNAVATTGGGKNELDRITTQLGQLSSKGKVLSQDLRPIIEAAPAAAQALQKLYGTVDASDIQEQLAKQGKSSKDFIAELTTELGKLPKVTGGLKNAFENFSDAGVLALDKIGTAASNAVGLEDLVNKISDQITDIAEDFALLDPATQKVILGFGAVAAGVGPVLVALGTLAPAVVKGVESLKLMGGIASEVAVAMGPVGLGLALAVVAAGLVYFAVQANSANAKFEEASKKATDLNTSLDPLIKTYEELSHKQGRTAEEQELLNNSIKKIGDIMPGAITQFDKYGKALDINIQKVRAFRQEAQDAAQDAAKQAFSGLSADADKAIAALKPLKAQVDEIRKTGKTNVRYTDGSDTGKAASAEEQQAIIKAANKKAADVQRALDKLNPARLALKMMPLILDDNNNIKEVNLFNEARKAQIAAEKARKEAAAKATADRKQSIDQLEQEVKALTEQRDALDKLKDAAKIGTINIEIDQKQTQIKQIKELGVGSKSDKKAAAKEISDQQKAQDALNDSLRKADLLYKEQGDKFDVAGAKAAAYQTYLAREIELDKTGKVEGTAKFKAILEKYDELTEASKQFKQDADISKVFTDTEVAIAAAADQLLGLGKYAGTAKEQVKVLEVELSASLNGIAALQKAGAGENDAFLIAERTHAKELTAELEKARAAAKQAKIDADLSDLKKAVDGDKPASTKTGVGKLIETASTGGNKVGDLLSGKAVDDIEERVRKAQQAVRDLQEDGGSQAQIEQAKDAVEGLKGQLDLTDLYAGAAEQASGALANIADVIVEGIGGIITGQTSMMDGLKGIFGKTLSIVGDFMKSFGKQLLLLGAGHVAMGIATVNPAMVTAGTLELVAGGALTLGGYLMSAAGSAITPSSGGSSTPTTSASSSPSTSTKTTDKQNITVKLEFPDVILRADGPSLVGVLSREKGRQNMR